MRRRVEGKVSHSADFRRAAVSSAAYPHFPNRETWLPYGYRAELAQVMVCAELGIPDCDFLNNTSYLASWLAKLRSDRKEIFRAAADAQRIADYLLAYHPAYAAKAEAPNPEPPTETEALTSADVPLAEAA
jgi:antirestriction protein ArdC